MKRSTITIIAVALLSLVPAITYMNGVNATAFSEDHAVQLATDFLMESPTYSYDGIPGSIELVEGEQNVDIWTVTHTYTSRHSGYGDREDQMLLQVLTNHTLVIKIRDGKIISAINDGKYNELTEEFQSNTTEVEETHETALEWLRAAPTFSYDGVEESLILNASRTEATISMPTLDTATGENKRYILFIGFECRHPGYGDRTGLMLAQVLTPHMAIITVEDNQVISAVIDETWDELHQVPVEVREQLPPEKILEITINHLSENYPEAENLTTTEWTATDITPEINVKEAVMKYTGDSWTITIRSPTPAEPNFLIDAENTTGFEWSGEFSTEQLLDQSD